jgi:hypothetical protein
MSAILSLFVVENPEKSEVKKEIERLQHDIKWKAREIERLKDLNSYRYETTIETMEKDISIYNEEILTLKQKLHDLKTNKY